MRPTDRRYKTDHNSADSAELVPSGAPGRTTLTAARYGRPDQDSRNSDGLRDHLRQSLAARRQQLIGGEESEEWDNPIARDLRAEQVIERRKEEQNAELDNLGAQHLVSERIGEERARPVIERRQAELGQDLDQLRGQRLVTRRLNRINVETLRSDSEKAGGDAPFSLHAMQGMRALDEVLASLRQALLRYVRAIRAKEELRTGHGVNKLKKISRKDKRREPDLADRIAAVRTEKDQAKAEFDRLRATVDDYLADPAWRRPEIVEEVNQLDRDIAGVTDEEIEARVENEAAVVEERSAKVSSLGKLAVTLELSEAKHHRLLREVRPLTSAGVGAREFSFKFSVSGSFLGFLNAGGGFTYSGKTDIQDDRRLRVSRTWGAFGGIQAELASVLAADGELGYGRTSTEVFIDAEHWAADMAFRLSRLEKNLHKLGRGDDFDPRRAADEHYNEAESGELMATKSVAEHDGVTRVTTNSVSTSTSGNVLGYGASYGYNRSWMTFEKPGADGAKQRRHANQSQHSFQLSIGNLSATFTRTWIDNHANPDNDGTYWNVKLALSGKASTKFQGVGEETQAAWLEELEADLLDRLDASESSAAGSGFSGQLAEKELYDSAKGAIESGRGGDLASAFAGYLDQALLSLDAQFAMTNPFDVSLQDTADIAVEWNVQWNSKAKARLQYRRFSRGKGIELSGQVALGAAPVAIGASGSKGQSTMIREKLGDDTSAYLQTVFDGLRLRDQRDIDLGRAEESLTQWHAYARSHRTEIWRMFRNVADQSSKVYGEIMDGKTSAERAVQDNPDAATKTQAVVTAAQAFVDGCSARGEQLGQDKVAPDVFAELERLLTDYFEALAQLNAIVQAARWERVE